MPADLKSFLREAERLYWRTAMAGCPNLPELAKIADLERSAMYRRLEKLGLRSPNKTHAERTRNRGNDAWRSLGA